MSRQTARQVLDQFHMRPALIAQRYAGGAEVPEVTSIGFLSDIRELASADPEAEEKAERGRRRALASAYGFDDDVNSTKPFVFANGKAIIPIHGILINRCWWSWTYVTGYNFIRSQVSAALADPDVDGIVYDVNTYGGMVAGCQETADIVYAASKKGGGKPSIAVVDANCYSAGYYLMSAADSIAVTPTGGAGSIGVMMMHMDMSGMLDKIGIKVSLLFAGDHKVDGNPYEPLSKEVTSDMQAELQKMYDTFVSTVVRNRPSLSDKAVRDTQARCYMADDALAAGLIDSVKAPPEALEQFFSAANDPNGGADSPEVIVPDDVTDEDDDVDPDDDEDERQLSHGNDPMTTKPTETAAAPDATAIAAAAATARAAERTRVAAILGHAEAAGRTELATHIAMNTDMDVEAAAALLKTAPKAAAAPAAKEVTTTTKTAFQAAMENTPNPNVGGNGEGGGEPEMTAAQRILGNQAKASGRKLDVVQERVSPQKMLAAANR